MKEKGCLTIFVRKAIGGNIVATASRTRFTMTRATATLRANIRYDFILLGSLLAYGLMAERRGGIRFAIATATRAMKAIRRAVLIFSITAGGIGGLPRKFRNPLERVPELEKVKS